MKLLDAELKKVIDSNDSKPIEWDDPFDDEILDVTSQSNTAEHECDGFKDNDCQHPCKEKHLSYLKITIGPDIKHFCRPTHMIRFILKYQTSKSKNKRAKN